MKWSNTLILFVAAGLCGFSSCLNKQPAPTVVTEAPPPQEKFTVAANVKKAQVKFSSKEVCTTPCELMKRSDQDFTVTVSKEGYKTATKIVRSVPAPDMGAAAANTAHTPPPPRLIPNPLAVTLEPSWAKD